jgi:K+-sensing histidine kinase KdpD
LRNPLAPIRNSAKVLITRGLSDPTQKRSAEIIGRQVQHMARLLEDLLDVSRISRNRLQMRREWVELAPIIENAVEASRPAIDGANHVLTVDIPAEPIHLDADAVRLTQVVSNVLNNAAKYTEPPGRIQVEIRSERALRCLWQSSSKGRAVTGRESTPQGLPNKSMEQRKKITFKFFRATPRQHFMRRLRNSTETMSQRKR